MAIVGIGFIGLGRTVWAAAHSETRYAIEPLAGRSYPEGFIRWANSVNFRSPESAIRAVRNPRIRYRITSV